ncbi:MAG TPA: DUF6776 family protein [Burkholderiales bacterium]|nr:DUF6776 family protein [Burkholderiales bacterium]
MKTTILWKLRQRFGITAPRVAVRAQIPWYARWLGIVVLAGIAGAAALWVFDAGLQFAGYDLRESAQERTALKRELDTAREELARLRALANAADSKLSIERAAQQNLAKQVRALEADNAKLREEAAIFESMLAGDRTGNLPSIRRFKVEPLQAGEYRYRLLVLASGLRRGDFRGHYDLVVRLTRDGRNAMITLPESAGAAASGFGLEFKHFQRVEGTFRVPAAARVDSVQVRIYDTGSTQVRAMETVQPG